MSNPFSPNYVSQLAPLPTQGKRQSRPVIVPLPKNPQARLCDPQPSREDAIRRGNSFCNGVKA
jgi:hypothetical protein